MTLDARLANELYWSLLKVAPPQTHRGKVAGVACPARDTLGLYQVFHALFTRETQAVLAANVVGESQRLQESRLPAQVATAWH